MKTLSRRLVLICISFTVFFLASGSISNVSIDTGDIELLFLFDDGQGDVAMDSSGNGRHGDVTSAQWVDDGRFGGALEFTGAADDMVITSGYFGVGGIDPRTTAFWWNSPDSASRHSWVKWGTNVAGQKYYIRGDETVAGIKTLRVEVNGGQSYGSTNVCDGEWHHLAVVFPDGSDSVKDHLLYVDGILEENPAGTDQTMDTDNTTTEVHIGTKIPGVDQHEFANGIMDELVIFSAALSQDDINTVMTQGLSQVLAVDHSGKLATTWGSIKGK